MVGVEYALARGEGSGVRRQGWRGSELLGGTHGPKNRRGSGPATVAGGRCLRGPWLRGLPNLTPLGGTFPLDEGTSEETSPRASREDEDRPRQVGLERQRDRGPHCAPPPSVKAPRLGWGWVSGPRKMPASPSPTLPSASPGGGRGFPSPEPRLRFPRQWTGLWDGAGDVGIGEGSDGLKLGASTWTAPSSC